MTIASVSFRRTVPVRVQHPTPCGLESIGRVCTAMPGWGSTGFPYRSSRLSEAKDRSIY